MEDNGLRSLKRVITGHDTNGKPMFTDQLSEDVEWQELANGARFSLGYATTSSPVNMDQDQDLSTYENFLADLPGIAIPGGTVLRIVDMKPESLSPMHRTVSLDYGVVLEGEVELQLDTGEKRLLKRGDVAIQRGTNHAWRNPSSDSWARMLYVLQEAKPLQFNGRMLGEDYGEGMDDVKPSTSILNNVLSKAELA
ncbi:hypothetical protein BAUCODRAFT_375459 [Baudoinia panamericana UAMH 10762]|uniref:Cupin type-2 domain-containing protein n=1 Tax=Baudoinia panamericana (strain UAMH 10762) TaxID=717646 RepID=M2NH07_BAUPA|nr:uncharacterized protein BAUCODRAFT_375459 [Baudoinia panamericana UAMH 10762]EMC98604.1 hypothetical protein BAUCODRAFT_375459 [Baudoinia panamericana UAMH 10762]